MTFLHRSSIFDKNRTKATPTFSCITLITARRTKKRQLFFPTSPKRPRYGPAKVRSWHGDYPAMNHFVSGDKTCASRSILHLLCKSMLTSLTYMARLPFCVRVHFWSARCSTTLHNEQGVFQCYCSFWKSKGSNNKLTRTNTPRNTLHSNIKISQVVLQKVAAIWKLFVCIYEFSPPVVTTDGFRKDVAKTIAGDWTDFLGLDVVRYFIFGFSSWFRIAN